MPRVLYSVTRTWRSPFLRRKLFMAATGPSVDEFPPPPPGHRLLVEGKAAIPFSEGNEVFYNKVQEFNRDLSIHVIKLFAEKRLREKTQQALRKTRKVTQAGESEGLDCRESRGSCWFTSLFGAACPAIWSILATRVIPVAFRT